MSTTTEEIRTLSDDEVATASGGIDMFGTLVHAMYCVGLMVPEILTIVVERARDDPWQN